MIYDTKGNILKDRPDFSLWRILQNEKGDLVYTTWEEVPQGQGYGEVPQDSDSETVTIEDRVTTLELAVAELGEMGA